MLLKRKQDEFRDPCSSCGSASVSGSCAFLCTETGYRETLALDVWEPRRQRGRGQLVGKERSVSAWRQAFPPERWENGLNCDCPILTLPLFEEGEREDHRTQN